MLNGNLRQGTFGRQIAASVAALAVLFCAIFGMWHFDHTSEAAAPQLSKAAVAALADAGSQSDAGFPVPAKQASQDCAFHCDQHGRSLPSLAAALDDALPNAPKLLAFRDDRSELAQPDGLLEPPRS